jgi:hypothetical protein
VEPNFRVFRSTFKSWTTLCGEAAQFATEVGPERLLNIVHSEDRGDGLVVVWYTHPSARSNDARARVSFQGFRSMLKSWEALFAEAAAFVAALSPQQLISISHCADRGQGVVMVWYWE